MKSAENDVLNGMVISDQKVSLYERKKRSSRCYVTPQVLYFRTKWTFPKSSLLKTKTHLTLKPRKESLLPYPPPPLFHDTVASRLALTPNISMNILQLFLRR